MGEKELTNRQVVGIGTLFGFGLTILIGILISLSSLPVSGRDIPGILRFSLFLGWPAIIVGVISASIGNDLGRTRRATWIGAALGGVIGVIAWYWFVVSNQGFDMLNF